MPIYEYVCEDCGCKFDTIRSMKDADAQIACKNCQGTHTHRALSRCYSKSEGAVTTTSGCAGCSGGSCGSCHH